MEGVWVRSLVREQRSHMLCSGHKRIPKSWTQLKWLSMHTRKNPKSQSNHEKSEKTGDLILHDFKFYYKSMVIKTFWYWYKKQKEWSINKSDQRQANYISVGDCSNSGEKLGLLLDCRQPSALPGVILEGAGLVLLRRVEAWNLPCIFTCECQSSKETF